MRCYFIGGSLDGMIKEIREPYDPYLVPVLTEPMPLKLVEDGEVPRAVRTAREEYRRANIRIAGPYHHLNGTFQEVVIYYHVRTEMGR